MFTNDVLKKTNRASAHAQTQHCCTNLAKRPQHHATSTNVGWKIWPFSNLSQQHATCRNMSQQSGQTRATCYGQQCWDMLRWMLRSFGRGFIERGLENELSQFPLKFFPVEIHQYGYCWNKVYVLVVNFWIKAVTMATSHLMTGTYFPHFGLDSSIF